jgi:acetyl esterase
VRASSPTAPGPNGRKTITWGPRPTQLIRDLSPLRIGNLTGLAPAVIATAGFDALVDQGEAYARAVRDADVAVTYCCYDSLPHGFIAFGVVPATQAALRQIAGLVRAAYEGLDP